MNQLTFISKARSLFTDNSGRRKLPYQESGKYLDSTRLARAPLGERRIFMRPIRRKYHTAHIVFLLDCSGSMNNGDGTMYHTDGRLYTACRALHALGVSLDIMGISFEAILFAGGDKEAIQKASREVVLDLEKLEKQAFELLKKFGAYNCDHEAVRQARELALKSRAPASYVIVLSDGQPACMCPDRCGRLRLEIGRTRKARVTVLAIGIQTDSPIAYYGARQTRIVHKLPELYPCALELFYKNLVRG